MCFSPTFAADAAVGHRVRNASAIGLSTSAKMALAPGQWLSSSADSWLVAATRAQVQAGALEAHDNVVQVADEQGVPEVVGDARARALFSDDA